MANGQTNRIPFEEASDLLDSARACVAFVVGDEPHIEPAVVVHREPNFAVGVAGVSPGDGVDEAVLVIDDGVLFFDLRAIYVRGSPHEIEGTTAAPLDDSLTWFEIRPALVTTWDYGRLRADDEVV